VVGDKHTCHSDLVPEVEPARQLQNRALAGEPH
jgi:hypothetical protein